MENLRKIVCSAIRQTYKTEVIIVVGRRHWDATMHATLDRLNAHLSPPSFWDQGFIDQKGVFLNREEAWIVAEAAGQIIRRVGGDGIELYSENLY